VGDSPVDHQAARAAGLPVALVSFGYTTVPVRSLGPDHVLEDFAALRRLLGA
jgi:phosphoglycolate phosphatase